MALPDNLGGPLFGSDGFSAFSIEIHYNNPELEEIKSDNSGLNIFYTSELREHEAMTLTVGLNDFFSEFIVPPHQVTNNYTNFALRNGHKNIYDFIRITDEMI